MGRIPELCTYYISLIRCVAMINQNSHWMAKGKNSYGSHLLFERIYNNANSDADAAVERFIGLWGNDALDLHMQAQIIGKTLEEFAGDDPLEMSLKMEERFLEFADKFYKILEQEDALTLGLEDLLPSISSNRENSCYLLRQAMNDAPSKDDEYNDVNYKMAARKKLLKRIKI